MCYRKFDCDQRKGLLCIVVSIQNKGYCIKINDIDHVWIWCYRFGSSGGYYSLRVHIIYPREWKRKENEPLLSITVYQALCMHVFSRVWLFETLWTVTRQPPLSVGFSRLEFWSGLPFPPSGDLSNLGIEPHCLHSRQTVYLLSRWRSPIRHSALHIFPHYSFKVILWCRWCYSHFSDETKA